MGSQVGGSADLIAKAYKKRRMNNLSRTSKCSRDKDTAHKRSSSDLKAFDSKQKEIEKRLVSKKIETSNPYVTRKAVEMGIEDHSASNFTSAKAGQTSKGLPDISLIEEKPQTAERARKSRAHRMS
jgi:hypothetical protein